MPRAYAKINLGLRILRKREDGFHDIETVFHPVDLYDTIEFRSEDSKNASQRDIIIECSDPSVPLDESNLCWQAADALRRSVNTRKGVRIFIDKKIPVGAGLGGGSSDAGCVLRELPKFWNVALSYERLYEIAASLGSDVPYFLRPGTALATGRGDVLEYFDFSLPCWVVVVYPNIRVSTRWAYENWTEGERSDGVTLKEALTRHKTDPGTWRNELRNDFEEIIFQAYEVVKQVKEALYEGGADFALMSGSGSAVYGLFREEKRAREVLKKMQASYSVFLTKPNFRVIQ